MPSAATSILDGLSTSVAVKAPCRTVATSNITLSGLQTISGYATAEDDRVLVKGQTSAVDNGIYMASTGSWTRAKDADGNRDLVQGTRVLVRSTAVDGVEYELTTANPIVIGTTALTFTLRYGANATYDQTEAEIAAGVIVVNTQYQEGVINRYGNNTTPGTTDMTVAVQAAVTVAHYAYPGGSVYGLAQTYLTTAPIVFPLTSRGIKFYCAHGAVLQCNHNGDGIYWVAQNENYGGHVIEGWTLNGPNQFLPTTPGYVSPSVGAGIDMARGGTTNINAAYNNVIRDVTIQGFHVGMLMQCTIGVNTFGSFIQYNQYGIYIAGGATNGNHWFGTHVRYNRKAAIYSDGTTGGSLTAATANSFTSCLIESNIAYVEGAFPSGGNPPADNTAIYLSNSYDFVFRDCYSENHSVSIWLTGGSKGNKFLNHRIAPGTGRLDQIVLDGSDISYNVFDIKNYPNLSTEVTVVSNHVNQNFNKFTGQGINFVSASILAPLQYDDITPALSGFGSVGLVRMPSQGYVSNVSEAVTPGNITGIGTASATLHAAGYGEIRLGNGITGNTTITAIDGLVPHQLFVLTNLQASFGVTIDSTAISGALSLFNGQDVVLNAAGQQIVFWCNGALNLVEVGRNFKTPVGTYTRTATVVESRTLAANASATAANNNSVLAALIADLQTKGIIS
jgi:hypothetical protein